MLKRVLLLIGILFCISPIINAGAKTPVDIKINGEYIYMENRPFVKDGRTYVPVRVICEALKVHSVSWNGEKGSVTITTHDKNIKLYVNSKVAYVNNEKILLDDTAYIINNRVFVPVRFIGENLSANVEWNSHYKDVEINKTNLELDSSYIDSTYGDKGTDLFWMARIIHAESQGEPFEGKIAVGDVVKNRVKSNEFPNTIYDVIFDRKYAIQFEPVQNGTIYNSPSSECIMAAKISLRNDSTVGECLYFFEPTIATSSWIANNRVFYTKIGNHVFYL